MKRALLIYLVVSLTASSVFVLGRLWATRTGPFRRTRARSAATAAPPEAGAAPRT